MAVLIKDILHRSNVATNHETDRLVYSFFLFVSKIEENEIVFVFHLVIQAAQGCDSVPEELS